ncbi:MAG: V-type ATP synthase subunit I [Candidatus Micrarchaeia archaeon]
MFPEKMLKAEIVVLKSRVEKVVESLHRIGVLHIVQVENNEWVKNAPPLKKADDIAKRMQILRKVMAIANTVNVVSGGRKRFGEKEAENLLKMWDEYVLEQGELKAVEDKVRQLEIVRKLGIRVLPKSERVFWEIYEVPVKQMQKVAITCEKSNVDCSWHMLKEKGFVLIAGSEKDKEVIRGIAKEHGLIPLNISFYGDVDEELHRLGDKIEKCKGKISDISSRIADMLRKVIESVKEEYEQLEIEFARAEVIARFGESERIYLVKGWIRERDRDKLNTEMKRFGKDVAVILSKPEHGELPPTSLKTEKNLKPFESLLTYVSVPRSDEIDPTNIIALTLPIMFGMIVGDVGYSIVLLMLSMFLIPRLSGILKDIMYIVFYSSFFGILWGLVFAEFFGFEIEFELLGISFPIINRLHNVLELLLLTIAIGAIHIGFGNFLGFIEGLKHKDYKHAIGKLCWVALELGVLVLIFDVGIGSGIILISLVGIVASEGAIGLIEVPGLLANIMSYTRIAAVGLSGVILALLINMMRPDPGQGMLMILTGILFVVGHFVAIMLAAFESLIQGGRLHAVEFFSKFFKGGGIMFNPFRMKKEVE